MTDRNVTIICTAADKVAAEALVSQYPMGAGTFSVALTTVQNSYGPATHWAGSGYMDGDMVAACEISVAPMLAVVANENTDFNAIIASREPRLFRVLESI